MRTGALPAPYRWRSHRRARPGTMHCTPASAPSAILPSAARHEARPRPPRPSPTTAPPKRPRRRAEKCGRRCPGRPRRDALLAGTLPSLVTGDVSGGLGCGCRPPAPPPTHPHPTPICAVFEADSSPRQPRRLVASSPPRPPVSEAGLSPTPTFPGATEAFFPPRTAHSAAWTCPREPAPPAGPDKRGGGGGPQAGIGGSRRRRWRRRRRVGRCGGAGAGVGRRAARLRERADARREGGENDGRKTRRRERGAEQGACACIPIHAHVFAY